MLTTVAIIANVIIGKVFKLNTMLLRKVSQRTNLTVIQTGIKSDILYMSLVRYIVFSFKMDNIFEMSAHCFKLAPKFNEKDTEEN